MAPDSHVPLLEREPVLVLGLLAAALATIGTCLVSIGQGVDVLVAIGTAFGAFGTIVGGLVAGRGKAYSPASVDELVDAHAVIERLEQS